MSRADRRTALTALAAAAAVVAVALLPLVVDDYWTYLATSALILGLVAASIGVVTGRAGMLSLCQLSFAAVGAYGVAWCQAHAPGLPFVVKALIGTLLAVPVGVLVGLPALRLRGVNLAIVTLTFAVAVAAVLADQGFPGANSGTIVERPGFAETDAAYFRFVWVAFVVVALLLAWAGRRRLGAAWLAVRQSERATAALGLSVVRIKLGAFAVAAAVAGLAGALSAGQTGVLTAATFSPLASLSVFALAIFIGAQYPVGAVAAGVLVAFFPEILRRLGLPQDLGDVLFALGAIQALSMGSSVVGRARSALAARAAARAASAPAAPPPAPARAPDRRRPGGAPVLQVDGLTVRFGAVVALDGAALTVPEATVCGLIGPNGAGKSTMIDAVSGFTPYAGTVRLDGRAVDALPPHRRARAGLRRTFQHDRTIGALRVGEYARLAAPAGTADRDIAEALAFLGCPAPDVPLERVDVGGRRLVELAAALCGRPRVVLVDEPAAGLAEAESRDLAERLAAIPERFGAAALVVDHDMELVQRACAHVTVLDFGRVIGEGSPAEVLSTPDVVAAYLGEAVPA
ncbi:MAG TPA: ATP-binding cassette domain-containing protein [Capillimicrobium sp.]|nr:ATP-binding cassette domain-containing protein [Capillimicrobium sp.]